MSKEKKKSSPKKKETKEESTTKKVESKEKKKKRGNKKEETVTEVRTEETEEPSAPTRLEAEPAAEEEKQLVEENAETTVKDEVETVGEEEAPVEAPVEEEKPEEEKEEGLEIVEEKFYDLNLRRIWTAPRLKRTPRAVRYVRDFVSKRMKSDEVSISEETNQLLWARGISKPPRHLRLRVVKDKEDRVIIFPAETKPGAVAVRAEEEAEADEVAAPKPKTGR